MRFNNVEINTSEIKPRTSSAKGFAKDQMVTFEVMKAEWAAHKSKPGYFNVKLTLALTSMDGDDADGYEKPIWIQVPVNDMNEEEAERTLRNWITLADSCNRNPDDLDITPDGEGTIRDLVGLIGVAWYKAQPEATPEQFSAAKAKNIRIYDDLMVLSQADAQAIKEGKKFGWMAPLDVNKILGVAAQNVVSNGAGPAVPPPAPAPSVPPANKPVARSALGGLRTNGK